MSRDPPAPLPGGYKVRDKTYYVGASITVDPSLKIVHGQQGEVTGPSVILGADGVCVLFPGNKGSINCRLTEVRTPRLRCPLLSSVSVRRTAVRR